MLVVEDDEAIAESVSYALERAGFRQVRNLTGGMLAWVQAGHPVQH